MALSSTDKKKIIEEFATVKGDTGSPEVQIALLTSKIKALTSHLKDHAHDNNSRRGLLTMLSKRRRLIYFLQKIDKKRTTEILKKIDLKN